MKVQSLANSQGRYLLWALDEASQVAERFGFQIADPMQHGAIKQLVELLSDFVVPTATGVLVDPEFSWPHVSTTAQLAGVSVRLEEQRSAVDPMALPKLFQDVGCEWVAENYGICKLAMWYHPSEPLAMGKKQLLAELADSCRVYGTELYLQLQPYIPPVDLSSGTDAQIGQSASLLPDVLLAAVQELAPMVQLLSLPLPNDALLAATITAELDIPWLIDLRENTAELATQSLQMALEAGASGCVCGNGFWPELGQMRESDGSPDWEGLQQYGQTVVRERATALRRVLDANYA